MVQGSADNKIDLLLTDVVMPGMGGQELVEKVKALYPETKVIFTSGYVDDATVYDLMIDEGNEFIQKPFTPTSLTRKVREVLDG